MCILDVGSGNEEITLLLTNTVGSNGHVDGIDINENAIAAAQKEVADQHHVSMSEVFLAWLYAKGVAAPIVGATKPNHFLEACKAIDLDRFHDMSHQTTIGILKNLKKKGLISYLDNPNDARSRFIVPTSLAYEKSQSWRPPAISWRMN